MYDGYCNLCNASVRFVLRNDKKGKFYFASLESQFAETHAADIGVSDIDPDTVIYLRHSDVYLRSEAVLHILNELGGWLRLFSVFLILPRSVTDFLYNVIARNRYRWFGRKDSCPIPQDSWKDRFLE